MNMNFKKTIKTLLIFAGFAVGIILLGILSYFTATGKAPIGLDPVSVEAQRALIAKNTFWWLSALALGAVMYLVASVIAHVQGKHFRKS